MAAWDDDSSSDEFDIEMDSIDSEDEHSNHLEKSPEFLELCHLARTLDADRLRQLNSRPTNLHMTDDQGRMIRSPDGISPILQQPLVEQMIKENHDDAVTLLLSIISIKRLIIERAIEIYFATNKLDKVEELLTAYPQKNYQQLALDYYASLGATEKVDALLAIEPAWTQHAQYIYAAYGHLQQAENLLARGGSLTSLISGYAAGGQFDKLNQSIESTSRNERRHYRLAAVSGLKDGGHLKNDERMLRALSHIDSNATRVFLMDQPAVSFRRLQKAKLLKQSKHLNHIMRAYNIPYDKAASTADSLSQPGLREWFLHGRQPGSFFGKLPYNLFINIAMRVTELSYQEAEALYLAVCRNTHDGARAQVSQDKHSMFAKNNKSNHGKREREPESIDQLYDAKMRRIGR